MPIGTGVVSAKNLPTEPYIVTDAAWRTTAKKNVGSIFSAATGPNVKIPFALPQVGIVGQLLVTAIGTLTVAGEPADLTARWPYGLIEAFNLSVNGQQNLFSLSGMDLHVREAIAFPAYTTHVDSFPGSVGGNTTAALAVGKYLFALHWLVPISTEMVTLSGGLYAQSPSTSIRCTIQVADTATLAVGTKVATVTGTAKISTIDWTVSETFFVPAYSAKGEIIVPSGIALLHSMTAVDVSMPSSGVNQIPLVRGAGNLQRLFVHVWRGATSSDPAHAGPDGVTSIALNYGQKQTPLDWDPALGLAALNNRDYGFPPPYDYMVIDTLKLTPVRTAIVYAGLTTLKLLVQAFGATKCHIVQEDIFQ